MKSFNLGKTVKKWLQQGSDYNSIAKTLDKTPEECIEAYRRYMGFRTPIKSSVNLEELILRKKKIHLYGDSGVGKSYSVKLIAEKNSLQIFYSYARLEEDLVRDFGDEPFESDDSIYVLEGDGYYWRKYGLVKRYIEHSKSAFIIITNGKDTPTKNITKLLEQVKVYPPTRVDVAKWLKEIDELDIDVNKIYSKDWRKVIRNYLYNYKETFTPEKKQSFDARTLTYKLLKGEATPEDFDLCIHPLPFVLNWLGWNTPNFYEGKELSHNMEIISFVDSNKYSLNKEYLQKYLLQFIPTNRKSQLYFPPFKRNKEKEPEEESDYEITKYKKRKVSKPTKAKKSRTIEDELGDFLLI